MSTGTTTTGTGTAAAIPDSESPYTEEWLEGPFSTRLYTRLYLPPQSTPTRAVLVFVHGYIEHIGRYTASHAAWANEGVAVFSYDMRGFGQTALGEGRSSTSAYGKTGGATERKADLEWAVLEARRKVPSVPVYLMGHSMGGGLVLSFMTSTTNPPARDTIELISGVIASSPLVRIAKRKPNAIQYMIIRLASKLAPNLSVPSPVQWDELSHDPAIGEEALKDPLIKGFGRMQGLYDMMERGEALLTQGYKTWPKKTPVLILHGTEDGVNAFEPTKQFSELLEVDDKKFIVYEGMMHDLMTEPDVKDKYARDCIDWLTMHLEA